MPGCERESARAREREIVRMCVCECEAYLPRNSCCTTLHHTAPLCNTLQHTITHCSTLQHNATQWYHMGQTGRNDHASLSSPARLVPLQLAVLQLVHSLVPLQLVHSRRARFPYKLIHWFYYLFFIRIHYWFFVLCLLCITNHCHVLFFIYYLAFQKAASTDTSSFTYALTRVGSYSRWRRHCK